MSALLLSALPCSFTQRCYLCFQAKVAGSLKELVPEYAVSDLSLAIIGAQAAAYNRMRLHEYLAYCWDVVKGRKTAEEIRSKTVLVACAGHVLRSFPIPAARTRQARRRNHVLRSYPSLPVRLKS